ncbi:universal stress protein [Sporomusa acidovorans]|uniref:Stress response protein NhaX n=1 Tax=Sporomusa acidovorans (strain ATCC 49682 / DSM 3132 / Mol) TaxID=1123286 RepID=A0ABZ3J1Z9_SPOA4|nr:universal stress protein [Sporomusa acidovorans]OZC18065.1 stress response protein NhaX [Sporomusa acidovorans DSM 3132]SDF73067.1 Nucleotide-binding universal stress protein, UspA family [Sporomusa acidovorans]
MDVKKMVVAYDGSAGSHKALAWAVSLAAKLGGDVVVVSVVKPPEFSSSIDEVDEWYEGGEKQYRPLLEQAAAYGEAEGVSLKTEILRGHPAESIIRYAADRKADLIVTGTRGMGGFKSLVIGSVAQKVVTYAKVPVVVVK